MKRTQILKFLFGIAFSVSLTGQVLASSNYGPGVAKKEEAKDVSLAAQLKAAGETDRSKQMV